MPLKREKCEKAIKVLVVQLHIIQQISAFII